MVSKEMHYWSTSQTSCIDCEILIEYDFSSYFLSPATIRAGKYDLWVLFKKIVLKSFWWGCDRGCLSCVALCVLLQSFVMAEQAEAASLPQLTSTAQAPVTRPVVYSTSPQLCYSSLPAERSQCCAVTAGHFYLCVCICLHCKRWGETYWNIWHDSSYSAYTAPKQ